MDDKKFYRVVPNLWDVTLPDHLTQGYETERQFRNGLGQLLKLWHDRVGEAVDERNDFLLLRFHDTPGGKPDVAWIPRYLLQPADPPDYINNQPTVTDETDSVFGFE